MGDVVVDLEAEAEETEAEDGTQGPTGRNSGELELEEEEAIWRSIDAADSSSGVSVSGGGGGGGCACVLAGAFPWALADIPIGMEVDEEEEEEEAGPRLRNGTWVEACDLIGSKQWVEEGGEGRYVGERGEYPTVPTKVPKESGEGRTGGGGGVFSQDEIEGRRFSADDEVPEEEAVEVCVSDLCR